MKVLLVNKFYYRRGGDCTAVLETERLLKSKGHEVAIFSVNHSQNDYSSWESYFPSNIDFSSPQITKKLSAAARIFYSAEVARNFKRLLNDFRPDVVHLHNIHSYISPLVAKIACEMKVRVVWTLHDYKLICPTYLCLHDSQICEKCFHKLSCVFTNKCMKNSRIASLLAWIEALYWNKRKLTNFTDVFISPSNFLKTKMIEAGYPANQIEVLSNFMPEKVIKNTDDDKKTIKKATYYCYAGRLSAEKGLETLLEVASKLPYTLKIAGDGPLFDTLRNKYPHKHIQFLGIMTPEALYPIIQQARFVVMPSIWYENNPLSIIESLCIGTPALGARIGGITELINEGKNGFLFTSGNTDELRDGIHTCFRYFDNQYDFDKIAYDAQNKFGAETFYKKLIKLYDRN